MLILAFISVLFLLITNALDIAVSVTGIRAGVAVEGNPVIRHFFGSRPTLRDFIIYDGSWLLALTIPAVVLSITGNLASALFVAAAAAKGTRHVQGFLSWHSRFGVRLGFLGI